MAKEFDLKWNDITNWNVITFNHRLKFLEHDITERNKTAKKQ